MSAIRFSAIVVLLLCAVTASARLSAQATNDTWEGTTTNDTLANASSLIANHVSPTALYGGVIFNNGTSTMRDTPVIIAGDQDWWQFTLSTDRELHVHLNQTSFSPLVIELGVEILDSTGTVLVDYNTAAPSGSPPWTGDFYYRVRYTNGDGYEGVHACADVTAGTYYARVYNTGLGAGTLTSSDSVSYELSIEYATTADAADSSEGAAANNFFVYEAADATGFTGATHAGQGLTYQGWDYYYVDVTQLSTITATLSNFTTGSAGQPINFDLYWVSDTGNYGWYTLDGASDSWQSNTLIEVQFADINASESITTPPLYPGRYYFQVCVWDTSTYLTTGVNLYTRVAGTYDLDVSITTGLSDDLYEDNDTAATATTLTAGTYNNLKLYYDPNGLEEDWYKVQASDGDWIEVQLVHTDPSQDDYYLSLYKPNTSSPGQSADLIDLSNADNPDANGDKGQTTAKEIVGTWGTVGSSGSTGQPDGWYYIRVDVASLPYNGGYSLVVNKGVATDPGLTTVAPEDAKEPNDNFTEASGNASANVVAGLNTGFKAMDRLDEYHITVNSGQTVEVTLIYDAGTDKDLDLILVDLDGWDVLDEDYSIEAGSGARVTLTTTAGASYGASPPASGEFYIAVQRWASKGIEYSLNVNIDGQNPLTSLEISGISVTPGQMNAGLAQSVTATVTVANTSTTTAALLSGLSIALKDSQGVDVTSEYTVTGPVPALSQSIGASSSMNFDFTITGNPQTTNGTITVVASGLSGSSILPGAPNDTFTVNGGVGAAPAFVYASIVGAGNLDPGGVLQLNVVVSNVNGRAAGQYGDDGSLTFVFTDRNGADISAYFNAAAAGPSPSLPIIIARGAQQSILFTFGIAGSAPTGLTTVTISGGGNDNPSAAGQGTFYLGNTSLVIKDVNRLTGACSASDRDAPWALLGLLPLVLLAVRRRRRA